MKVKCAKLILFLSGFLFAGGTQAAQSDLIGEWKILEAKTQTIKSVVSITAENPKSIEAVNGRIVTFHHPETPNNFPICANCAGGYANKAVLGMRVIKEMSSVSRDTWKAQVLDTSTASWRVVHFKLNESGDTLTRIKPDSLHPSDQEVASDARFDNKTIYGNLSVLRKLN